MVRTKTTPYRRVPSTTPKYSYGSRATMTARRNARGAARRRLEFETPMGAVRPYKTRTTSNKIGFAPGTGTTKKNQTVNVWTNLASTVNPRTLYIDDLTAIPQQDAAAVEINRRDRQIINCSGFGLRFYLRNTNATNAVGFRMAVVSPTHANEIDGIDFFRGYGTDRDLNFLNTLDSHEYLCNPINTDNFTVLWQKKIELAPDADTVGATAYARKGDNWTSFETFVPLGRQIRYAGPGTAECTDKVFLVCWYCGVDTEGATAINNSSAFYKRYAITYWREP